MNDMRIDDNSTGLRFAGLVRVSTELQGRKGESLKTQRKRIESCVKLLDGSVVQWYEGQEHSSKGFDRPNFDKLLADAKSKLFDAVMVVDISRWSRDLMTSLLGLRVLQENGIRFYIDGREHDFNDPNAGLILNVTAATSEWQVKVSTMKSIQNRVERARRGWPCGNMPFGRKLVGDKDAGSYNPREKRSRKSNDYDKRGYAEWEIIPEDKMLVDQLFDYYVNQSLGFDKIAALTSIEATRVRDILINRCGDEWIQTFKGYSEPIVTKVPPLLTPEQIGAVRHRAKTNRQFRTIHNVYPLSHYVKCGICGATLTSTMSQEKNVKYHRYLHLKKDRNPEKNRTPECLKTLRGDILEQDVFSQIGQMFKNTENLKTAIQQVLDRSIERKTTIIAEVEKLNQRQEELNLEKSRVISLVRKGLIDESDVEKDLNEIKSHLTTVEDRINQLYYEKQSLETNLSSENLEEIIKSYCAALTGLNGYAPATWTVEDKQKLARFFFGTKNKTLGVFVKPEIHPELGKCFSYLIRGMLGTAIGAVGKEPFEELADMSDSNPCGAVQWNAKEQARLARQFFGAESQRDHQELPTGEVSISDLKELVDNLDMQQMSDYSRPRKNLHETGLLSSTVR